MLRCCGSRCVDSTRYPSFIGVNRHALPYTWLRRESLWQLVGAPYPQVYIGAAAVRKDDQYR